MQANAPAHTHTHPHMCTHAHTHTHTHTHAHAHSHTPPLLHMSIAPGLREGCTMVTLWCSHCSSQMEWQKPLNANRCSKAVVSLYCFWVYASYFFFLCFFPSVLLLVCNLWPVIYLLCLYTGVLWTQKHNQWNSQIIYWMRISHMYTKKFQNHWGDQPGL